MRPKSVEADIDGTISLYCDVDGNPSPDILWIHEPHDRVCCVYIYFNAYISEKVDCVCRSVCLFKIILYILLHDIHTI